ncbi:MAG: hypothetical protein OEW26_06180, partial [Nitrospirota bacterium]|nr:hypothetical protein [Nitrospirota bacterium]
MAITTGNFAMRFGVPQQFLMPEYRGVTGILSFTIVGFALGGFIVAFNLYTYILHGFRFPFIATLSRPFQKLTLNNFILPAIFLITYIWESAQFQYTRENVKPSEICWNIAGLLLGISLFLAISFSYFLVTNKSAESYAVPGKKRRRSRRRSRNPVDSPIHRSHRWTASGRKFNQWHVETYLFHFWKINLARESSHYKQEV